MIPLIGKVPGGLTLQRYGATDYSAGRPVFPAPVAVAIAYPRVAVVPASRATIRRLPEGVGAEHAVSVYSYDELRAFDELTGARADRFDFEGRTYEVQNSTRQPPFLGIQPAHWEADGIDIAALPMPEGP